MSSQDTMGYAEQEEESAKVFRQDIDKYRSEIQALQSSIDEKNRLIADLEMKERQHLNDAQRLREQAADEQRQEEQDRIRHEQEASKEGLAKRAAKNVTIGGLFG